MFNVYNLVVNNKNYEINVLIPEMLMQKNTKIYNESKSLTKLNSDFLITSILGGMVITTAGAFLNFNLPLISLGIGISGISAILSSIKHNSTKLSIENLQLIKNKYFYDLYYSIEDSLLLIEYCSNNVKNNIDKKENEENITHIINKLMIVLKDNYYFIDNIRESLEKNELRNLHHIDISRNTVKPKEYTECLYYLADIISSYQDYIMNFIVINSDFLTSTNKNSVPFVKSIITKRIKYEELNEMIKKYGEHDPNVDKILDDFYSNLDFEDIYPNFSPDPKIIQPSDNSVIKILRTKLKNLPENDFAISNA